MMKASYSDTLCLHCMQDRGANRLCPHCGHDEHRYKNHPLYLKPGTCLKNQYLIGHALGQGGFGITYIGLDQQLQKKIAVKEYLPLALVTRDIAQADIIPLKQQELAFTQGLQLFIEEARNLAKFDHPNIVRVFNFFEAHRTGYMVMEYLEGQSLADVLSAGSKPLPVSQALAILLPILDALIEIHAQCLYHRDISAQNIRLLKKGVPVLIDFGAARHIVGEQSQTLDLVLKHGYSPLEQYSGKGKIGPWTDIYACGALLYLMIIGTLPPAATDRSCQDTLLPPTACIPAISPSISEAIMRALAIHWKTRFQQIIEFKAALTGQTFTTATSIGRVHAQNTQYPRHFLLILVIIPLLAMLALFFLTQRSVSPLQPLLDKAQLQWSKAKLLSPRGDNAYETYQAILKLAPDNEQASIGINNIVKRYQQRVETARKKGQLTQALHLVQQGLQIMPTRKEFITLEAALKAALAQQQQQARIKTQLAKAEHYFINTQFEAAYQIYQAILADAPDHWQAKSGLQLIAKAYYQSALAVKTDQAQCLALVEAGLRLFPQQKELLALKQKLHEAAQRKRQQLADLLKKAAVQLKVWRLTEPKGDNAYETYQQVLALVPDHPIAQAGLIKIADQYEKLAQNQPNNPQKALNLVEKGLQVHPDHSGLNRLKQTLMQKIQQPPKMAKPPPVIAQETTPPPVQTATISSPAKTLENEEETVKQLLNMAHQHLATERLEAAYDVYQDVLALAPRHHEAVKGLQQLANRYEQLAYQRKKQGDWVGSLSFVNKGLVAYAQHKGLLALQQEIAHRLAETPAKKEEQHEEKAPPPSKHIIFTPSF